MARSQLTYFSRPSRVVRTLLSSLSPRQIRHYDPGVFALCSDEPHRAVVPHFLVPSEKTYPLVRRGFMHMEPAVCSVGVVTYLTALLLPADSNTFVVLLAYRARDGPVLSFSPSFPSLSLAHKRQPFGRF